MLLPLLYCSPSTHLLDIKVCRYPSQSSKHNINHRIHHITHQYTWPPERTMRGRKAWKDWNTKKHSGNKKKLMGCRWKYVREGKKGKYEGRKVKLEAAQSCSFSGAAEVFYLINPQHIFNPVRGTRPTRAKGCTLITHLSNSQFAAIPLNPHPQALLPQLVLHPDCRRYGLSENQSRNVTPDRHISQDHRMNMFSISPIW